MARLNYLTLLILVLVNYVHSAGIEMFFDNMLKAAIIQKKEFLDPFKLENIILDFGPHFGPFSVKGEAKLYNITLNGLSTIKRTGDLIQTKSTDGNIKKTRVRMTVGPLNFTSNGVARFSGVSIKRNYLGTIDRMDCETTMIGNKQTQTVRVTNYDIKKLVGLKLKSMDRRFLDPITNRLISGVMGVFSNRVKQAMQTSLKTIIEDKINDLPPAFKGLMIN